MQVLKKKSATQYHNTQWRKYNMKNKTKKESHQNAEFKIMSLGMLHVWRGRWRWRHRAVGRRFRAQNGIQLNNGIHHNMTLVIICEQPSQNLLSNFVETYPTIGLAEWSHLICVFNLASESLALNRFHHVYIVFEIVEQKYLTHQRHENDSRVETFFVTSTCRYKRPNARAACRLEPSNLRSSIHLAVIFIFFKQISHQLLTFHCLDNHGFSAFLSTNHSMLISYL